MGDWQVNPFGRGFRHLSFPFLVSWDFGLLPTPQRADTHEGGQRVFLLSPRNKWVGIFSLGAISTVYSQTCSHPSMPVKLPNCGHPAGAPSAALATATCEADRVLHVAYVRS